MPDHEVLPPNPDSAMPHLGTYRRVLPVSLERMYENTLDWEHLPFVHASSFADIRCLDAGPWGWQAELTSASGRPSVIELKLDRGLRRWITRTLEGHNAGAEIWTHAFPIGEERVDIVVDFYLPGIEPALREKVGAAYASSYERLYDEDVAMMVARQRQLDRRISTVAAESLVLGARAELALPLRCELGGRSFVVAEVAGALVTYPALCPHQLGPLEDSAIEDGVVVCPWHGYRFDVVSGECVSGHPCRFGPRPEVVDVSGTVSIEFR